MSAAKAQPASAASAMITSWIGTHMVATLAAIAVQAVVSASRISSRSSMRPFPARCHSEVHRASSKHHQKVRFGEMVALAARLSPAAAGGYNRRTLANGDQDGRAFRRAAHDAAKLSRLCRQGRDPVHPRQLAAGMEH